MIKQARVGTSQDSVYEVLKPHLNGPKYLLESIACVICKSMHGRVSVRGREITWDIVVGTSYGETDITIE